MAHIGGRIHTSGHAGMIFQVTTQVKIANSRNTDTKTTQRLIKEWEAKTKMLTFIANCEKFGGFISIHNHIK